MAKILIVDDDNLVTTLLEKLLSIDGFETKSLNESALAVETAREMKPDLFLIDLMMPQPDGFRLCRMLREIPEFSLHPHHHRHRS
jgi:DNA-binding response OmpR family regulator